MMLFFCRKCVESGVRIVEWYLLNRKEKCLQKGLLSPKSGRMWMSLVDRKWVPFYRQPVRHIWLFSQTICLLPQQLATKQTQIHMSNTHTPLWPVFGYIETSLGRKLATSNLYISLSSSLSILLMFSLPKLSFRLPSSSSLVFVSTW